MNNEHSSRSGFWFAPVRGPLAALGCMLALGVGAPLHAEWLYREAPIMGTRCDVELWTDDHATGEAAIDAVFADMQRFDDAMSTFKPESEVSHVNATAAAGPVKISQIFHVGAVPAPVGDAGLVPQSATHRRGYT